MKTNFRNTVQHTKGHCNTNKPKGCCTAYIQKKVVMQTNQKGYCAANIQRKVANKPKSYCKTNKHEDL